MQGNEGHRCPSFLFDPHMSKGNSGSLTALKVHYMDEEEINAHLKDAEVLGCDL